MVAGIMLLVVVVGLPTVLYGIAERYVPDRVWDKLSKMLRFD